jgi:hypothetical protein
MKCVMIFKKVTNWIFWPDMKTNDFAMKEVF